MDRPTLPPVAAIFFATTLATCLAAARLSPLELTSWTMGLTLVVTTLIIAAARLHRWRTHALITALCLVVTHCAIVYSEIHNPAEHPIASWLDEDRKYAEVELRILDGPVLHDRGVSYDARLISLDIDDGGHLTAPAPRLRLFYPTGDLDPCSPLPLPGDRVSTWASLERFAPAQVPWRLSARQMMENRGYMLSATAREEVVFLQDEETSRSARLRRSLVTQRIELERRIASHVDGDGEAMAVAMLTGSRGKIDAELREPFDITSTGHILAISGLHFAIIAGLIALLIRLLLDRFPRIYRRLPRRIVIGLISLVVLAIYLLFIGAPVSARRAFGMIALAIAVISLSPWRLRPLSALAVVASILLLFRPTLVIEPGYQLSVTATGGILLFLRYRPPLLRPPNRPGADHEPRHHRWLRSILIFVGVSFSATIATWPVLLRMTGELPVAGLWANLVVVPLVSSLLFPLLVAGAIATYFSHTLAELLLTIACAGLTHLHTLVDHMAYAPGSVLRWGTPSTVEFVGAMIVCTVAVAGGLRLRAVAISIVCALLFALPGLTADRLSPEATKIHFIYVGQGDATLVELPDGTTILIDGGGRPVGTDPGLRYVVPYLRHRGIRRLDAVVVTHGDYDHYGGLFATIRPFRPRTFYVDPDDEAPRLLELREEMEDAGTHIEFVDQTTTIATDDVEVHIHRPSLPDADPNDRSLTASFSFAGAGVLLAGDLEAPGESWLVDHVHGPHALVKAPHHGSRTSSSAEFIEHFQPSVAVSSSGRHNRFGHPHTEVVDRYHRYGVDLFRTDQQGAIVATITDDGILRIHPTHIPE